MRGHVFEQPPSVASGQCGPGANVSPKARDDPARRSAGASWQKWASAAWPDRQQYGWCLLAEMVAKGQPMHHSDPRCRGGTP